MTADPMYKNESLVVVFETTVAGAWLEMCRSPELFARTCCGYWARGVEYDDGMGWLIWESPDKCRLRCEPDRDVALVAWRSNAPLPPEWFRLDVAMAENAWVAGVRRWGEGWFLNGDHGRCDVAVQEALFGEVRYG